MYESAHEHWKGLVKRLTTRGVRVGIAEALGQWWALS